MTTTNELDEIKAQYFKSGWDAGRADALAAVPTTTEARLERENTRLRVHYAVADAALNRIARWVAQDNYDDPSSALEAIGDAVMSTGRTIEGYDDDGDE